MSEQDAPRVHRVGTWRTCDQCGQRLIRLVIEPVHRPADVDALREGAGYWPVQMIVHPTPGAAPRFAELASEPRTPGHGHGVWMVSGQPGSLFLPKDDPRSVPVVEGWELLRCHIPGDALPGCAPLTTNTAAELWEVLDALEPK